MKDINSNAGAAVSRFRKRIGLSQLELAQVLGITRTSVSNIERGKQAMSLAMFCRVADILHVDATDLLNEVIRPKNTTERGKLEEKGVESWVIDIMQDKLPESSLFFLEGGDHEQKKN